MFGVQKGYFCGFEWYGLVAVACQSRWINRTFQLLLVKSVKNGKISDLKRAEDTELARFSG